MSKRFFPTTAQAEIRDAPGLGVLVIAPAGCGKTEALALRVQGLVDQRRVVSPQRVLVLTFTNRARDNIRERLQHHVSAGQMRAMVTVSNFHGFAARLIRAHGNVIGIAPDVGIPSTDWAKRVCRDEYGLGYDAVDAITTLLRVAKEAPRTDAEVLAHLRASSSPFAVQLEERRQADGRITYDDMLRLAELILANEQVADLYRKHFAAILVDEFQDLTPQQLRVVQRIGLGRTTYAGDLAQGIYGFAGAKPDQVLADIRTEVTHQVGFAESHRSSPAVLDLVNAMAPTVKGQPLTCADSAAWPGGGVSGSVSFPDQAAEAAWVHNFAKAVLNRAPLHRIAVVARYLSRRAKLDSTFEAEAAVPSRRWDQPFVDKESVALLRDALQRANASAADRAPSCREYLWDLMGGSAIQDPSSREALNDAASWAADLHTDGAPFAQIASRVRALDGGTILTAPGVHLLNGHLGKGQQFDWVIVAGLEQGTLPFFKSIRPEEILEEARVLSVMISRARHGVVLTRVTQIGSHTKLPSQFLEPLETVASCRDKTELTAWLNSADWQALAAADAT